MEQLSVRSHNVAVPVSVRHLRQNHSLSAETPSPKLFQFRAGGQSYCISHAALNNFPNTPLAFILLNHKIPEQLKSVVFISNSTVDIDTNPRIFDFIVDAYRTAEVHPSSDVCPQRLERELRLWGIPKAAIADCCLAKYKGVLDDYKTLQTAKNNINKLRSGTGNNFDGCNSGCRRIWTLLEFPRRTSLGTGHHICSDDVCVHYDYGHGFLRLLPGTQRRNTFRNETGIELLDHWDAEMVHWLLVLDSIISAYLLVEFMIRFICCPNKKYFCTLFLTWVDILAIFPIVVAHLLEWLSQESDHATHLAILILNIFMLFRILRLFHLVRVLPDLQILVLAFSHSIKELLLLLMFVTTGVCIFGVLMFYAEIATSDTYFTNIPTAFWWALVTMTTVGYGDTYPKSVLGMFLAALCACCGLIVIVLPIPIIANNFYLFYSYFNQKKDLLM